MVRASLEVGALRCGPNEIAMALINSLREISSFYMDSRDPLTVRQVLVLVDDFDG